MDFRSFAIFVALGLASRAAAQADPNGAAQSIDACGVLSRSGNCVVFEGAGGTWYIPDTGNFEVGDAVRVTGLADPGCVTICTLADGCIRGAVVYDPVTLPCGTPLPNFPADICTGVAGSLAGLAVTGLWLSRHRSRR